MRSQIVVDFARKYIGSHYLWGGGGSTPDARDGVWYRPDAVTQVPLQTDRQHPAVHTAECSVSGHYVCAGRFEKVAGGGVVSANDPALRSYLAELEAQLPNFKPHGKNLTPRLVKGANVSSNNRIVWGEDCHGKRHFDCISFVNWVLSWTTTMFWSANILLYGRDASGTRDVPLGDRAVPGDILLRGQEHIGLLCENGYVIQAQDHATGVHEDDRYIAARWSARRRLPDHMFLRSMQRPGRDGVATIEYTVLS